MREGEFCQDCGAALAAELGNACPACMWGDGDDDDLSSSDFEFGEEIARGGMGIVYRARQREPEREVAAKMLLPQLLDEPGLMERFASEARVVASLDHPGILPVYSVGEQGGVPFFTMKLAEGGSLADRLRERGKLAMREAVSLVADVAEAIAHAHSRGVLHRDLKPGNILFDSTGRVFVSDFGLAKVMGEAAANDLTRSIAVLGTPQYLPPEIARGSMREASTAGDIYSLGAVLYELLAGHPPFEADTVPGLLRRIADDEVRPVEGLPADLRAITGKCLEKEPAQRYRSAQTLADDLRAWLDGREVLARRPGRIERVWRWARRNPVVAVLSIGLVCALAGGFVLQVLANAKLSESLADSLIAQAAMARRSGEGSARESALALLEKSAEQGAAETPERAARLRSESAAALALPSLIGEKSWRYAGGWNLVSPDFAPDLASYAAPMEAGGFAIFDTATQSERRSFASTAEKGWPAGYFAFDAKGESVSVSYVNVASNKKLTEAYLVSSGELTGRVEADGIGGVVAEALSPDGSKRAIVMEGESGFDIGITDAIDARLLGRLRGHGSAISRIVFHPSGESVVSVGFDGWVVWQSTEPGGFRTRMPGNPGPLVFSADGMRLGYSPARGSLGIARLSEPVGWRRWMGSSRPGTVTCVEASRGKLVIASLEGLLLWECESGERLDFVKWDTKLPVRWPWFRIAPGGEYLVCSDSDVPMIRWPILADRFGVPEEVKAQPGSLHIIHDFTADGSGWLVSADREQREASASASFLLWSEGDFSRGRMIAKVARANGIRFVPPGADFAVSFHSHQNNAQIWDCAKAVVCHELEQGEPVFVNVSADGARVCTVGTESGCLWETKGWTRVAAWSQAEQGKCVPAFSPDSKQVATVTPAGHISIRAAADGQLLLNLVPPRDLSAGELVWAGAERIALVSGVDGIWEWDLRILKQIRMNVRM
jgi:WD40 repeat protein